MHIFFTHIPKTAGTTFRSILINNFAHHHMDWGKSPARVIATPEHYPFYSRNEMSKLSSVSGHGLRYTAEMKSAFPAARFIIFIRDPVDRLISLYKHMVRSQNNDLKFHDWVGDPSRPEMSDWQTRFITGDCDVQRAKDILNDEYFFAGKSELFDESMCLLSKMLNDNIDMHYKSLRVSKQNSISIKDNPEYKTIIESLYDCNKSDLILNEYVGNTLLTKYKDIYGDVTNEELSEFKSDNSVFRYKKTNKKKFLIKKNFYYRPMSYFNGI